MDMVTVPHIGLATSAVGFGCAGLGGRLGMARSLDLLSEAGAHGIVHLDVARSYGYGAAEAVVGRFLHGRRDKFVVVSKLGILPPPRTLARRVAVAAARRAVQVMPSLRQRANRRAIAEVRPSVFDLDSARASLEASLRALRSDYLDLLMLHECTASDMTDELVSWLDETVLSGRARAWGIATSPDQTREILHSRDPAAINIASSASQPNQDLIDTPGRGLRVLHSAVGSDVRVAQSFLADPRAREEWEAQLGQSLGPESLGTVMLQAARGRNMGGVVLASTQRTERISSLAAAGNSTPDPAFAVGVQEMMTHARASVDH